MAGRLVPLVIENCRRWFKFLCPKTWGQLERTGQFDVRYCPSCRKDVYYCASLEAVEEHRRTGHCLCIEVGVEDEDSALYLGEPSEEE